jgi:hypothetical protein
MKTTLIGIPALTILSACISLIVTPAWADDLTVFSNGKVADANDVNANFNELETRIKTISLTPGETGAVGAQGIQGSQGFTGAAGANGAQGIQGLSGNAGTNGVNGAVGAKGDAGAKGAKGIQGLSGNAGTNGVNGAVGAKGDAGAKGVKGVKGVKGAKGAKGATGAQGLSGDAGASGATGLMGLNGATGAQGIPGLPGDTGADGVAGAQGIQGLAGADSIVAGADGADGADGIMYDGAFEGDMQYWNGNAWMMITAPTENASSLSFCDGQPTWTQGGCPVVVYEVGDTGPAGGIVFYVSNEGLNGLEAAPADQGQARWGCFGTDISGANGTAVGTGEPNTADIIVGCDESTAALVASTYGPGWYLPSRDELNILFVLNEDGIGSGYEPTFYWSSSETSAGNAWYQSFDGGFQFASDKRVTARVRAVRAF